jgi:hypothetical protein
MSPHIVYAQTLPNGISQNASFLDNYFDDVLVFVHSGVFLYGVPTANFKGPEMKPRDYS